MNRRSPRTVNVFKRDRRSDRGQATIEFALVFIMLFLAVVAILELMVFVHTYNVLADAAKEGVRYAIVHGANNGSPTPATCTALSCACPCTDIDGPAAPPGTNAGYGSGYGIVKTFAQYSLHSTGTMTVTVSYPGGTTTPANKTPNLVKVTVSYPYQWFLGLGWAAIHVNASSEGRIMN
jgi:Flp pilus assembly protein TadG